MRKRMFFPPSLSYVYKAYNYDFLVKTGIIFLKLLIVYLKQRF